MITLVKYFLIFSSLAIFLMLIFDIIVAASVNREFRSTKIGHERSSIKSDWSFFSLSHRCKTFLISFVSLLMVIVIFVYYKLHGELLNGWYVLAIVLLISLIIQMIMSFRFVKEAIKSMKGLQEAEKKLNAFL